MPLLLIKILAVVIGGALGYIYYRFVGCHGGGWGLTGNPVTSVVYGAVVGFMITTFIK